MTRPAIAFLVGAALVGSHWALRPRPAAEPRCPNLAALEEALVKNVALQAQVASAERRLRVWKLQADLWRLAAERSGTPQSWGGSVVSTIYLVPVAEDPLPEPDLIPPPLVPVPTRPSGEKP